MTEPKHSGVVRTAPAQEPEPEIAAGPPTVSGDRTTYTFELRKNVRFSPPSTERVTAQSFEGFALRGTISHGNFQATPDYWRYQVRRSLTIGDVVYTVSGGLVLGNAIDTLAEVARVPL